MKMLEAVFIYIFTHNIVAFAYNRVKCVCIVYKSGVWAVCRLQTVLLLMSSGTCVPLRAMSLTSLYKYILLFEYNTHTRTQRSLFFAGKCQTGWVVFGKKMLISIIVTIKR